MLEQLIHHQERIKEILTSAEQALLVPGEPDVVTLARLRWRLGRTLREYQLFKHGRVFDPLIARGGPQADLARRMKDACMRLGDDYRDYTLEWSQGCVGTCWPDYQPAALAMIKRLRDHLREEREGARSLLRDTKPAPVPLASVR